MSLTNADIKAIVKEHGANENDTGKPEVQIAILTAKISYLTDHMKQNKHDVHSRRGLIRMVNHRRKLLNYLMKGEIERYRAIVKKLGLRR